MIHTFFISLFIIFLAELGDKTQIVSMCLASKLGAKKVFAGVCIASFIIAAVPCIAGVYISSLISHYAHMISGMLFIFFGIITFCFREKISCDNISINNSSLWYIIFFFTLAEMGDKTQLTTAALSIKYNSFISVWLGTSLGLIISNAIGIYFSYLIIKILNQKNIIIFSSVVFILLGILISFNIL